MGAGVGRNAVFLAEQGYDVDALDFSEEALARARELAGERAVDVEWLQANISEFEYASREYDVVLVSYHHDLDVLHAVKDGLATGGMLVFEHHLRTEEAVDRGPTEEHLDRPNRYRFRSNELLHNGCARCETATTPPSRR